MVIGTRTVVTFLFFGVAMLLAVAELVVVIPAITMIVIG